MRHWFPRSTMLVLAIAGSGLLAGCDGGTNASTAPVGSGGKARLQRVEYGRLVDVYAYRRRDASRPERRDVLNREIALVARDVVIGANVTSESLFANGGAENVAANYRFLPFDVTVGHDELLILWDDTHPNEQERFSTALSAAQSDLTEVPAAFRNQNTTQRPIPVMPRNAAIVLTFDRSLGLDTGFFEANPAAVQVLEFIADPERVPPNLAYRPLSRRLIAAGNRLIIDTTVVGGEVGSSPPTTGLPPSANRVSANIRIALPTAGALSNRLLIEPDPVPELNGPDMNGDPAVIRDFRSGNSKDPTASLLRDSETPMLVKDVAMGILSVDPVNNEVTLNKRQARVVVRGRIPYVDGGIPASSRRGNTPEGLPGGPPTVPTQVPLRAGDILSQDVASPTGELVRIRAEVLENLDVGNVISDPNFLALGLTNDTNDPFGAEADFVRLRLSTIRAFDADGNEVFLRQTAGNGADCTVRVHYYHNVSYTQQTPIGQTVVSDEARLGEFITFNPATPRSVGQPPVAVPLGEQIDPGATVSLRFSEPLDLLTVKPFDNMLLSTDSLRETATETVPDLIRQAKPASLSVLPARLIDAEGDGTFLTLALPIGHHHAQGTAEGYRLHLLNEDAGEDVVRDLAGNRIDIFDRRLAGRSAALSFRYEIDANAPDNLVGWRIFRFADPDEDGTRPGSIDFFGQIEIGDGAMTAPPTTRFSRVADDQTLPGVTRGGRGECFDVTTGMESAPLVLYQCPSNVLITLAPPALWPTPAPVTFGGVTEPLNRRGCRLQMCYREDDFQLSHTDPSQQMIDVEQMHWSSWNATPLQFDTFDRVSISAAHADQRVDIGVFLDTMALCTYDANLLNNGLSVNFEQNALQGSSFQPVVTDAVYDVNPNALFQASTGNTFVPYPRFQQTYTWRDSRLVTWDPSIGPNGAAVGLGGALKPQAPANPDVTSDASSPWIGEGIWSSTAPIGWNLPMGFLNKEWAMSDGDFRGNRTRDHDPIALPLLLDFKVWPDDPQNGLNVAANEFWIGYIGPCWVSIGSPNAYYGLPAQLSWPHNRVWTAGGVTLGGDEEIVDPANTFVATGGWIVDAGIGDPNGIGLRDVDGTDSHIHWAQADFVRKVSMATFGYFDTRQPNRHDLQGSSFQTTWPGRNTAGGFPDFEALGTSRGVDYRATNLVTIEDPPSAAQPPGTAVTIEFRGAESFGQQTIYNALEEDRAQMRGNLLNPNYACEAYRYASPNSTAPAPEPPMQAGVMLPPGAGLPGTAPRVAATGLTPYVTESQIGTISNLRGQLPRLLNFRIIMRNNTSVTPALTPSLRSFAIVYEMEQQ